MIDRSWDLCFAQLKKLVDHLSLTVTPTDMVDWKSPAEFARESRKETICLCLPPVQHLSSGIRWVHACAFGSIFVSWTPYLQRFTAPWMELSWEWAISLDFDLQFITRKKRFHWPMVRPWISSRYCCPTLSRYSIFLTDISCFFPSSACGLGLSSIFPRTTLICERRIIGLDVTKYSRVCLSHSFWRCSIVQLIASPCIPSLQWVHMRFPQN